MQQTQEPPNLQHQRTKQKIQKLHKVLQIGSYNTKKLNYHHNNFRATLGNTFSVPCYISEDDEGLKDLLRPLDALDLFDLLKDDGITVDYLNKMDLNDLMKISIPLERAQKFHNDLQTLKRLHQRLENLKCVEIYDKLLKIGHTSDELWSIGHNALKKAGLSFPDRKEVLNKMKSTKIKGNIYK